ncbi:TPA: hypothetical protein DE059_01810, partial [Candidatus Peribacteria bacterium]|nr:hypothetical protein [Candidatus Peribacteria bacterium]
EIRSKRDKIIESFVVKFSDRPTYAQCKELLELVETSPNATEQALIEDPVFEMLDRRYEWIIRQANERLPILFGIDTELDEESRPVGTMDASRIPGIIDMVSEQVWCELTEPVLSSLSAKGVGQYGTVMEAKQRKMPGNERVTYSQAVRIVREIRDAAEKVLSDLGDQIDPKLAPLLKGRESRMCADAIRLLGGHEGYEPEKEVQDYPGTTTKTEFMMLAVSSSDSIPKVETTYAAEEDHQVVDAEVSKQTAERREEDRAIFAGYLEDITYAQCIEILNKLVGCRKSTDRTNLKSPVFAAIDARDAVANIEVRRRLPELFVSVTCDEFYSFYSQLARGAPELKVVFADQEEETRVSAKARELLQERGGVHIKGILSAYDKPLTLADCRDISVKIRALPKLVELLGSDHSIFAALDVQNAWTSDELDKRLPELFVSQEDASQEKGSEKGINKQELFDLLVEVEDLITSGAEGKAVFKEINGLSASAKKAIAAAKGEAVARKGEQMEQLKDRITETDFRQFLVDKDGWAFRYTSVECDASKEVLERANRLGEEVVRITLARIPELFADAADSKAEKSTGPTIHKNELILLLSTFGSVARVEHPARAESEELTAEVLAECERLTLQRETPVAAVFVRLPDRLTLAECCNALIQVRVQAGLHVDLTNIDHSIFSAMDREEEWSCNQAIEYLSGKMQDANPSDTIDARPPMFVNSESSELFCKLSGCKTMKEHLDGLEEVFIDELGKSDGALYHQKFIDDLHNFGSGVASVIKSWSEVGSYAEIFLARLEVFCDTFPEPNGARLKEILIEGYRQCFDKSAQKIEEVYPIEGTPCLQSRTHFMVGDEEILIPSEVTSGLLVPPSETDELSPLLEKEVTTAEASDSVKAAAQKYGDSTQAVMTILTTENLSYCRFLNLIADLDHIQDEYAADVSFLSKRVQNLFSRMNDPIIEHLYTQGRAWFVDEQARRMEGQESGSITRERIWEILRSANRRADRIVATESSKIVSSGDGLDFERIMKDTVFRICPAVVNHPAQLREFGFWLVGRIEAIGAMNPDSQLASRISKLKQINENELDGAFREIFEILLASADAKKDLDDLEFALQILPAAEEYAISTLEDVRAVNPKRLCKELCDDLDNRFKSTSPKPKKRKGGKRKKNSGNGQSRVNGIPIKVVTPFLTRLRAELEKFMDEWMSEQIQTHAPLNAIVSFMQECHFQFQFWLSAENEYTAELDQQMRTILGDSLDEVITKYCNYFSGEKYQGQRPFAAANPKKPSGDSDETKKKMYPVPALITKTRTLEDIWREIEERNAVLLQQRELNTVNQVRGFAVSIWNNFRDQCAQLENFNVRDEDERDRVTSNALRCVRALETAMVDVVRQECKTRDLSEPLSLRPVEEAALSINPTDFSLPPEIAKCFGEAIISGYGSASDEVQEIDTEHIPILIASQKELIDRGVNELKAGMTCTFLRNMFAGVETKQVKLADRECSAVRGKDFSVEWARQVSHAVNRSVENFVSMRQPRKGAGPEEYVKGLFDSRIQNAIFQRARGIVEESLQRLRTGPNESVIGDLARVLPDLTQGEREASITTDELVGFVRVDLLGDRKPRDSLFPQEIPAIEQYCRNRNLEPNRDIEEQLKEDIAGLNQLAARFDHEFHADLHFRREGGGEQLLKLAVQIGARMALARKTADKTNEKRLREQAMDALLQIVHLKDLALVIEANSQWMKEWPVKHSKPDDQLGYWELRYAHEQSEAYLQRCRILGGEAPGFAAACAYAEDVREARERGVIVIKGGETPESSADDDSKGGPPSSAEASEGKKKRRTPRSLGQDTKRVKAYVERKAKRRGQLAVGEAAAGCNDLSPELSELVASLRQDDAQRVQLETLLRSLPDHTRTIEQLTAAIEGAQTQKSQADELLAELSSDGSGEQITQGSLVAEASSIMARMEGFRKRVLKERQVSTDGRNEEDAKNVAASKKLDQLARDGVTDPPILSTATNIMNNSAARRDEHAQRIVELTALESALDECELVAIECLDHFQVDYPSEPISEDGEIDDQVAALHAESDACLDRLEQFKKLATTNADQAEIKSTSERLGGEIERDKAKLKELGKEQKRCDDAQASLDEIQAKLAAVMQAYESPPTPEQEEDYA